MSLSFRTNGNFIDFVNTDATSLNVETLIVKLHNTSRCVDWSLPEDTTKISFTIDEVKYSNIPISEIDFDGTVMNSQDDFETGITAMFPGLAQGGGSGGGVESVTYQNSEMSSPVKAFVFKDESDNIYRVYEPIRNNDVSRSQFAYADSIDKFPFDSVDNFNSTLIDCKLVTVPSSTVFQGSILETMIITGNSKTGLQFKNHRQKGNYGSVCIGIEGATEIYITGNDVVFENNRVEGGEAASCFFRTGENSSVKNCVLGTEVGLNFYDRAFQLFRARISNEVIIDVATDNSSISLCDINGECAIMPPVSGISKSFLENSAYIQPKFISSHQITDIDFENKKITIAGDLSASNANILFVDTGNQLTDGYYKVEDITYDDGNDITDVTVAESINAGVEIGNDIQLYHHFTTINKSKFGVNSKTKAGANISIADTTIGATVGAAGPDPFDPIIFAPTTNLADKNIINIGEVYYEIGEAAGAATLTPV